MLATSERVRPCSARCSPRSVGRVTLSTPSSPCSTPMSRWIRSDSAPRGPVTCTTSGSIFTVTPSGTGMGFLPIRLIRSPDLRHDLAADLLAARVVTGHDALRRREDGGAQAALDLGDLVGRDVVALAGARDAAQAGDRRAAVLGVLQPHAQHLAGMVGVRRLDLVAGDVALLVEDPRHLALELGRGDVHVL